MSQKKEDKKLLIDLSDVEANNITNPVALIQNNGEANSSSKSAFDKYSKEKPNVAAKQKKKLTSYDDTSDEELVVSAEIYLFSY